MTSKKQISLLLNEIHILVLCGVLAGAFTYEFLKHELPCPLCFLQRMGMIAMAIGPLCNLRFGMRISHYAISILGALFSGSVSIRQILLHICKGFPEYGLPVFGLELYTWAFIVAVCSIAGSVLLLFLYQENEEYRRREQFGPLGYAAIALLFALIFSNVLLSFLECGLTYCPDNPTQFVY